MLEHLNASAIYLFKSAYGAFHCLFISPSCFFHSPSSHPCRCDFPMQRYYVRPCVKYRCATGLKDCAAAFLPLRYRPQGLRGSLPQIKDELSVPRPAYRDRLPSHACRVGYSAHSSARFLALPVLHAVCPACKIRSRQGCLKAPKKGKENNVQQIKLFDYA